MEKYYKKMLKYIHHSPKLKKVIIDVCHYFPYIPFSIYPIILIYLFITHHPLFITTLLKPLFAFLLVTIFRKVINRQRPYEKMNITPLLQHKLGESFPSRHAISAMIIALVCMDVNMVLGTFALIIAFMICLSRILAGVHYISDVFVSIVIAIIIYII